MLNKITFHQILKAVKQLNNVQMEEKLKSELKIKMLKVLAMKKPTILLNSKDLESLINEFENKVNVKQALPFTYQGFPVKSNDWMEKGTVIIYDDVWPHHL